LVFDYKFRGYPHRLLYLVAESAKGGAGGTVHGHFHGFTDIMVVGFWRWRDEHTAEPCPFVRFCRELPDQADRHEPVRVEYVLQMADRRRQWFEADRIVHVVAGLSEGGSGGAVHGHLDGEPDLVVMDLRRWWHFVDAVPDTHLQLGGDVHGEADRRKRLWP